VREYLARQRGRYVAAARAEMERLLDEVAAVTGYHRKAIIRALEAGRRRGAPLPVPVSSPHVAVR